MHARLGALVDSARVSGHALMGLFGQKGPTIGNLGDGSGRWREDVDSPPVSPPDSPASARFERVVDSLEREIGLPLRPGWTLGIFQNLVQEPAENAPRFWTRSPRFQGCRG